LDPLRWRITIRVPDSVMDFPQKRPRAHLGRHYLKRGDFQRE
jgi:hypothetical protein